ncbi:MAG: V-type ATP synthase subunit K [Candidatus Hodarchaeales archaeon]
MDSSLIRHNWKKIVISQIILLLFVTCLVILSVSVGMALSPSGEGSVAQEQTEEPTTGDDLKPIGVGLAIGLAGLGAALGMGSAASAAAGAITEKPENFGRVVIFLVFIEAVAIYGLVVAILLIYG